MFEIFLQLGTTARRPWRVRRFVLTGRLCRVRDRLELGGRAFDVRSLVEKPKREEAPSNLAIIGRYILTPTIFETLERTPLGAGGELQLTDGLRGLLSAGEKIYGYTFEGKRHDAGDKLGFLKATVEFALKRADLGPDFADYLRALKIEEPVH